MKSFEIKALGLEEMTLQEERMTEGGSLTLLVLAAAALLVTGCVTVNSTKVTHNGNGDVHVGDTKEGGTDVNTDLEVGVNP